ncbi:hypothetical protein pb186bvf_008144 [Paramecium bursaria]
MKIFLKEIFAILFKELDWNIFLNRQLKEQSKTIQFFNQTMSLFHTKLIYHIYR